MFEFFIGFSLAFPFAFILAFLVAHFFHNKNDVAYDITCIKEDLANLQVKLSGFLHQV